MSPEQSAAVINRPEVDAVFVDFVIGRMEDQFQPGEAPEQFNAATETVIAAGRMAVGEYIQDGQRHQVVAAVGVASLPNRFYANREAPIHFNADAELQRVQEQQNRLLPGVFIAWQVEQEAMHARAAQQATAESTTKKKSNKKKLILAA